jgi:large subunit ribosomal protein L25
MERLELAAERRVIIGKHVKELRREGLVPAVVFGHAIEPMSIQVRAKALRAVLVGGRGNRLISLKIEGEALPTLALPREIQRDALTAAIQHVDFQAVVMTEKLRTTVGLAFVGQSPAVVDGDGQLFHILEAVEIECLPGDLISSIQVDLSQLANIDDTIHVKDLKVSDAVKIMTAADEPVIRVVHVTEMPAEDEVVAAAEGAEEVEVIKKGKADEEAAE